MKTLMKTTAVMFGLLLLAGCTANAQDEARAADPAAYGPGWRHQQMTEAWERGETPTMPMMRGGMRAGMRGGPGMLGTGPGQMALPPDGTVDTTKLPEWCPYATKPTE